MSSALRPLSAAVLTLAAVTACSKSSTAPSGPRAVTGTWHVTVTSLTGGLPAPSTFDINVVQQADSFSGTMPASITWAGKRFDTSPYVSIKGDTLFGFLGADSSLVGVCEVAGFEALINTAHDSAIGYFGVQAAWNSPTPANCTANGSMHATH